MVANTGTYLDSPFHRYADGKDLPACRSNRWRTCPGSSSGKPLEQGLAIDAAAFEGIDVSGKAVLVHTGWDRHWRTDAYFGDHPFLTAAAADWLADMARRWSASTATISTICMSAHGRCTRSCSAPTSRSASI